MAVLLGAGSRVLFQGITGVQGTFFAEQAIAYGTEVVAGVTPGRGGTRHLQLPVFDTGTQAVEETGANVSAVFVPPAHAASAMLEAI
jgi:succinyl-CoA synthetase alpha subunit